ncbi:MAG: hypothetical protein Ta2F_17540 [Termitinemataceae bacterium]|nr:MAG: hypothetical protein Ta2F_17540 [Termitinemataceae bacterium]
MCKKFKLLLICIICCSVEISAQDKYKINDYGTYIMENKTIQKVPKTISELLPDCFIENYVVFRFADRSGCLLYNIDNGAISESFGEIPFRYKNAIGFRKNNKTTIDFIFTDWIYTLDAKTLKTIKKEYHKEYPVDYFSTEFTEITQPRNYIMIKENTKRCDWDDFYIDITFGKIFINDLYNRYKMKPENFNNYSILKEIGRNRFVLTVYYNDYGR